MPDQPDQPDDQLDPSPRRTVAGEVDRVLVALAPPPEFAAAAQLARVYAAQLDGAAAARRRADAVVERVHRELGPESALYEQVEALRAKVSETGVIERIGKGLLATLVELGATPKARAGAKLDPPGPPAAAVAPDPLTLLRGGRA